MAKEMLPDEAVVELGSVPEHLKDEKVRVKGIILLGISIFLISLGVNMHMAMNVNYLHELLAASSWQQGYLESIRETCGILSFFMIVLLAGRSEPRVASVMLVLVGIGLASYSALNAVSQVIVFSLLWSFGFHIWSPMSGSMQLALSKKGHEGRTLGFLGSITATGVLTALAGVYALKVYGGLGMRHLFLIGGCLTALSSIPMIFMPDIRAKKIDGVKVTGLMAKGCRLYCSLEMLDGMRRQVFSLFAVLTLVREYGIRVETIAGLMLVNQSICLVLAPIAGHLVDRLGERKILTAYFSTLVAIFVLYALMSDVRALFAIYIVDNAMFVFKVALPTYANRLVSRHERTRLLAMGTTMNHIGAVTLPVVGGALYATMGYRFPFYVGAGIAFLSVVLAQFIPPRTRENGLYIGREK